MVFLRRHKKKYACLSADFCMRVYARLSVWKRVYSQVLADILGLCGCGWWLASCAENREGTVYFFFCRNFYWSFVCVFTHVSVCMSVTRILILVVRRLFRDKTGGHGFRLSATSVHAFAAVCLFGLCHHCSLLFCFLMFLLSSNQVLRNFAFSRAPSIPFTASRVNLRLSYRLLKGRGSENDGSNGCIKDSSNPHVEFIAGFQQKENNGLE